MPVGGGLFGLRGIVGAVRMKFTGQPEKFLPKPGGIQPGPAGFIEQTEIIRHAVKLSPQEQLVAAFGFFTLKPPSSVLT